jgi:hypothetical protein
VFAWLVVRRMAARLVVLLGVVMSAPPPTPAPFAAPSAAPGRSAPVAQPAPVPNPKGTASKQWYVQAVVTRMGTGKATGTVITEKSPKMFAPTEEAAVIKQQEFINEYLHPKVRADRCLNPSRLMLGRTCIVFLRVFVCARVRVSRVPSGMRKPGSITWL